MALLGSVEGVKRLVQSVDGDDFTGDQETRLEEVLAAVSSLIETRIGITYGTTPLTVTSRLVRSLGVTDELWLPEPIVDLDSIVLAEEWTGTTWIGTTALAATYYLARADEYGRARAVRTVPGYAWSGDYLVTGTWASTQLDTLIPDDLMYVANYVAAEIYKKQSASPAGYAGPDGRVVLFRNALKEPEIVELLDKHARGRATTVVV